MRSRYERYVNPNSYVIGVVLVGTAGLADVISIKEIRLSFVSPNGLYPHLP